MLRLNIRFLVVAVLIVIVVAAAFAAFAVLVVIIAVVRGGRLSVLAAVARDLVNRLFEDFFAQLFAAVLFAVNVFYLVDYLFFAVLALLGDFLLAVCKSFVIFFFLENSMLSFFVSSL